MMVVVVVCSLNWDAGKEGSFLPYELHHGLLKAPGKIRLLGGYLHGRVFTKNPADQGNWEVK